MRALAAQSVARREILHEHFEEERDDGGTWSAPRVVPGMEIRLVPMEYYHKADAQDEAEECGICLSAFDHLGLQVFLTVAVRQ